MGMGNGACTRLLEAMMMIIIAVDSLKLLEPCQTKRESGAPRGAYNESWKPLQDTREALGKRGYGKPCRTHRES